MIQAIPTVYNGTRFRSRLEASYAKHFDQRGMPWIYEPEAFALSDGTNYLPDFWLPTARAWVEVKGAYGDDHGKLSASIRKVEQFATDLWAGYAGERIADEPLLVMCRAPSMSERLPNGQFQHPGMIGVLGIGRPESVAFARCRRCAASTITPISLGRTGCRNCNTLDATMHDPSWAYGLPFDYIRSDYKR